MSKTALLFIDSQVVKVVYGNILKCVKFSDLDLPHNQKFFETIFDGHSVFMVKDVGELNRESFDVWLDSQREETSDIEIAPAKAEKAKVQPSGKATETVKKIDKSKISRAAAAIIEEAEQDSNRMLFRSTAETVITVDDLLTSQDIPGMPGVKQSLSIFPYRAVDLGAIPPENLKRSAGIKKLIREGTLIPCTPAEARSLQEDHDRKTREYNDAPLDSISPILKERVEDFVVGLGAIGDSMDTHGHDAETINIEPMSNESGDYSIDALMKLAGASEDSGVEEIAPKRQLAARPQPSMNSPVKAKGINRL